MTLEVFVFAFILFCGISPPLASGTCASLVFPVEGGSELVAAETRVIKLGCKVESNCSGNASFVVRLVKQNSKSSFGLCTFLFEYENCTEGTHQDECSCVAKTMTAYHTATASQLHNGQWECSADDKNETITRVANVTIASMTQLPPPSSKVPELLSPTETKRTPEMTMQSDNVPFMPWVSAGAAIVTAVIVICFAARQACTSREKATSRMHNEMCATETQHFRSFNQHSTALQNSRLAHSEECVMIPNFLYQRTRSLPEIPDSVYQEVRDLSPVKLDIDNRPPASIPRGAGEGDYAEVNEQAIGGADANDYVPINEILERKGPELAEDTVCCSENIVDSADSFVTTDSP